MKQAETVTFGGSSLDRAGEIRSDQQALSAALAAPESRAILFWRGKPLVSHAPQMTLARLPLGHPVLAQASPDAILLGRETGEARFAFDLRGWVPPDLDESVLGGFVDTTEQQHPDLGDDMRFSELRRVMTLLSPRDAELAASGKAVLGWHATHGFCACCGTATEITQGGWQRRCPACRASHFPRTDPVVIMLITQGNSVLVGRSPGWPDKMYSLLAGFIEPGETVEAAVRREVYEEVGVHVGSVQYLASQPWPFPASLMIGCAGEARGTEMRIDRDEIEDALWISREEMLEVFAGAHDRLLPAREGAIARFLLEHWLADRLD